MHEKDFPAAHSMDTEWFAIDDQGYVGHFMTGEAGAVPNAALTDNDGADIGLTSAILSLTPSDGVEYYVDDLIGLQGGPVFEYVWETKRFESRSLSDIKYIYAALLLCSDESLFLASADMPGRGLLARLLKKPLKKSAKVTRVCNSAHIIGFVNETLDADLLGAWIKEGKVKRVWVNHDVEASRIGIYCYDHGDEFENWISGPYFRISAPLRPIKLNELPERVRELISGARLRDTVFERAIAVDPHDAGECSSWEQRWISLDGVVHDATDQVQNEITEEHE